MENFSKDSIQTMIRNNFYPPVNIDNNNIYDRNKEYNYNGFKLNNISFLEYLMTYQDKKVLKLIEVKLK